MARIAGARVVGIVGAQFLEEMTEWVREGTVRYREDVVDGLENAPAAFLGMLRGENFGKLIIRVAAETISNQK